ncbi:uncharacterized protein BDZ99DRAFT_459979 [Mytilinidion resinicola]|uniref:Uncharacterized protein n=1 Tax=Mytilinidion resinicola TaxID=574789 RepID=A0A6A6YZL5_9PEZI|nr:uncharacterized protein BDZ99DRAFT_459979 [Mytilinidion resinicola]KAF2814281.1 hypothetical protein BDZ99DRAFT_459979 [Mytilinidion resinicola]
MEHRDLDVQPCIYLLDTRTSPCPLKTPPQTPPHLVILLPVLLGLLPALLGRSDLRDSTDDPWLSPSPSLSSLSSARYTVTFFAAFVARSFFGLTPFFGTASPFFAGLVVVFVLAAAAFGFAPTAVFGFGFGAGTTVPSNLSNRRPARAPRPATRAL